MGLSANSKNFWYTETNQTQIWCGKFNQYIFKAENFPRTTRVFENKEVLTLQLTKLNLRIFYILFV